MSGVAGSGQLQTITNPDPRLPIAKAFGPVAEDFGLNDDRMSLAEDGWGVGHWRAFWRDLRDMAMPYLVRGQT
jgi:hypothetical protein